MIIFKGHKFNYAPDLNEFQTQNKSKTLIHLDQLYPIQSMISERTVPSMFFSQFDFAIIHSTKANPWKRYIMGDRLRWNSSTQQLSNLTTD